MYKGLSIMSKAHFLESIYIKYSGAYLIYILKILVLSIKYLVLRSVGYDNVNLRVDATLNIGVANVPSSLYDIVNMLALLLALNRKLI
jgi:lactate dehydrogenase-like 2-hydroxyacid dehydrogenase